MANRFSKKYGNNVEAFNYLRIKDAYQHLTSLSSEPSSILYYLKLNSCIGH